MDGLFQMLASAADGAFVINENQQLVYWNQAAQEILGYSPTEVIQQNCFDILQGQSDDGHPICRYHCKVATAALQGKRVTNFDTRIYTKSGELCWVNVSTFTVPLNDNSDGFFIVHIFRDVTRNKQNEQFIDQILNAAANLQGQFTEPSAPNDSHLTPPELTDREREVLALLADGSSTAEIAKSLSISPATARNHIQNILHKLQVHSRLEAVSYALKHGLINQP
jgi:PAS domain S-box-containing protein